MSGQTFRRTVGARVRASRLPTLVSFLILMGPLEMELLFGRASTPHLICYGLVTGVLLLAPLRWPSRRTQRLIAVTYGLTTLAYALSGPHSVFTVAGIWLTSALFLQAAILHLWSTTTTDVLARHLYRWRRIVPPVEPAPLGSRAAEKREHFAGFICEQGVSLPRAHEMLDQVDCADRDADVILADSPAGQPQDLLHVGEVLRYMDGFQAVHMLCVEGEPVCGPDGREGQIIVGYAHRHGRWRNGGGGGDGGGRRERSPRRHGRLAGRPVPDGA